DEVAIDEAGNVLGRITGSSAGKTILLLTHLDTAPAGDSSQWEREPFGGELAGGYLHGLGAAGSKGAIAAQLYAAAACKLAELTRGNILVAGVVHSERAECLGSQYLFDHTLAKRDLRPQLVVLGDPTGLDIFLGHRGRAELEITTIGRTSHSSAPWLGLNAAYKMIPVLEGIEELGTALPSHPFLDKSTVAVTRLATHPRDFSVIPDRCIARVDRRFLPSESLDTITSQLQTILSRVAAKDEEFRGEVAIRMVEEQTYTGFTRNIPKVMAAWLTSERHPLVGQASVILASMGELPSFDKWYFATEGSYVGGTLNLPTIGYSPGEERYSHTPYDRVKVDYLWKAALGTAVLASSVCEEGYA
ncbi:MAG: M20/M25/M40 family metallo-hydrolase, partial [Cyanobacteria bacterium NC_groundwater_1444_Ag_S-0.65um_54_12]|nr:M20/M25/M40 family metallo-hydrolase [Cyanobacteria bacterium NC_groundwater_1444_Ag_S-0.65um_54_12]